jgi:hypothetical protein
MIIMAEPRSRHNAPGSQDKYVMSTLSLPFANTQSRFSVMRVSWIDPAKEQLESSISVSMVHQYPSYRTLYNGSHEILGRFGNHYS